jgi:oligopeptide/dipeptide ABC transporter ATP-binding protein
MGNAPMPEQPLLRIQDLAVSFPATETGDGPRTGARAIRGRVRAVNGVNLCVYPNQTLAVVGESGCGKSVTALSILRLVPTPPGRYDSGRILWRQDSRAAAPSTPPPTPDTRHPTPESPTDLFQLTESAMRTIRGAQIAMIFQEPMTSLNPVYTIGEQILEAVLLHQKVDRKQAVEIAVQALVDVGIADAASKLRDYPHQLSGGMRQRIMIAMALACQPRLLLADEPTTALDVTIQAQILELLRELQSRRNMSVLLITHDLGVVAENADVVAVMYAGRIVEYGSVHDVFQRPLHPYTHGLFASMPIMSAQRKRLEAIPGNVPNPSDFPTGCPFHPRCAAMQGDAQCSAQDPVLLEVEEKHWVACWHVPSYAKGVKTIPDVASRREPAAVM